MKKIIIVLVFMFAFSITDSFCSTSKSTLSEASWFKSSKHPKHKSANVQSRKVRKKRDKIMSSNRMHCKRVNQHHKNRF